MKPEKVLIEVLQKISIPDKELKIIKNSANEIISKLKKVRLNAEIGGSLAKNTLVKKKNQDVDIFIKLDKNKINDLEQLVKKTSLAFIKIHGSRDYLQITKDNIYFELIPVLNFKKPEDAENVTDFSLVHVKYIRKKISKNKKLADEIRLAKAFCYANNTYGAESYIGGFSGYALEVLICHYKSFIKFLKAVQKDTIIDPENKFKNKSEIMREINQSKLQSPIILIDPTHKYRNICAGLTNETFNLFLESAKKFLKSPSMGFFEKQDFDLDNFLKTAKTKKLSVYELEIETDRQEGNIAGTKMKKFMRYIIEELNRKKQEVIYSEFVYLEGRESKAYIAFIRKEIIEIIGPRLDMKEAIKKFKKVRTKTYSSKGYMCAKEKVSIEDLLKRQVYVAEGMGVGFEFRKL